MLTQFHSVTRQWFESTFGAPTSVQKQAWEAIYAGRHTLIAAPTGSGKTLAAFYAGIDRLIQRGLEGSLENKTYIVYVSPLKALSNDIHRNLEVPIAGIAQALQTSGLPEIRLSMAVRTGDTTTSERQRMIKKNPHILVTTPESLYILLTSQSGRAMMHSVETVIIDEIHALIGDKRGSHLALSLERLAALTPHPLQRIGLSATQKPISLVACYLVGNRHIHQGSADCAIIDAGFKRDFEISVEVPKSPLSAVMSNEIWGEIYERLVELIAAHRTTLIFVNTRRVAERLARALAERLSEEDVSSHHGSMSKEHRLKAEQRLKNGQLKVLVATSSMELGIDIGAVDLVVQMSTPKSIAAFLQRIGRSRHFVGGVPKGILFPLSREELVESAALLDSIRRGELDQIQMPEKPLDILSQQIIAEAACQEWNIDDFYHLMHSAYPYRDLRREEFNELLDMVSEGFTTRRGRRGAYLHLDRINNRIRGRRGARLAAITNGGAIPDNFDYDVVLQPEGVTIGTLNEDFALESLAGDIFTLGNHAWQLVRIEGLKVIVHDAAGKPPTVPFWLGEQSGRTRELSESLSRLRVTLDQMLDAHPLPMHIENTSDFAFKDHPAILWLTQQIGLTFPAAEQLLIYVWMGKVGLGIMPTREKIVMERFFDETGDMHFVIHSPYGSRLNRAWGLALRKKFCRNFNFELQAAANENSIIFSLSSSHSFPVDEVGRYLNQKTVRETLIQAMLDAPLFEVRWRWNATRSLAILKNRNGKRTPPYVQRMLAEDLVAQVFPDQIACFENIEGERQIPDHPLVQQVIHDCLTEAMDIDELEELLSKIARKEVELIAKDLREPSIFAQEIINARPYAFLDDTEFAERRVNAVRNRGWLDPSEAKDLSKLDPLAIEKVKEDAWPQAQNADELHDILMVHGFVLPQEILKHGWSSYIDQLAHNFRALRGRIGAQDLWIATERLAMFNALIGFTHDALPENLLSKFPKDVCSKEDALKEIIRGRMEALGPVTASLLHDHLPVDPFDIQQSLLALEQEGFAFRGSFDPTIAQEQWCERRLLQRIHRYTIDSLRESIQPVSIQDYMRFLFALHRMREEDARQGPSALQDVLAQLEGYEAPAGAWESNLIPARLDDYDPSWLDVLCMSGKIVWGRFNPPKIMDGRKAGPIKSTPMTLIDRLHVPLWQSLSVPVSDLKLTPQAEKTFGFLKTAGASFFEDMLRGTGLIKTQLEEAIAELVTYGLIVSDSFNGLRALLTPSANKPPRTIRTSRDAHKALFGIEHAGRWSIVNLPTATKDEWSHDELEEIANIYLKRWGVLFRSIVEHESFSPPWRVLVRQLRRMELQGKLRGGRFISQVSGEQFALPSTIDDLRRIKSKTDEGLISISAADPLNLVGVILPGKRIARISSNRILFQNGLPVAALEAKTKKYFKDLPLSERWQIDQALIRKKFPPKLRYYLGRM